MSRMTRCADSYEIRNPSNGVQLPSSSKCSKGIVMDSWEKAIQEYHETVKGGADRRPGRTRRRKSKAPASRKEASEGAEEQEMPEQRASVPQFAVLPQDPNLANVMMAWYWAGYYSAIYQLGQNRS